MKCLSWILAIFGVLCIPTAIMANVTFSSYAHRSARYAAKVLDEANSANPSLPQAKHWLMWMENMLNSMSNAMLFFGLIAGISLIANALLIEKMLKTRRSFEKNGSGE